MEKPKWNKALYRHSIGAGNLVKWKRENGHLKPEWMIIIMVVLSALFYVNGSVLVEFNYSNDKPQQNILFELKVNIDKEIPSRD